VTRDPVISFVVPTLNAGPTINACLESLRAQTYPAVEIVVVDNGSTDDTLAIATRLATVTATFGPERCAQRNHGARIASGEILVFVDADMVLEPQIAAECAELFAGDERIGACVLPERSFGAGYFARCRVLEKELYLGDDRVEAARAFRRHSFAMVDGFDESMNAFEDWDLHDRVRDRGWNLGRIAATVWHNDGVVSPRRQFKKKLYYGRQSGRYLASRDTPRRRSLVRNGLLRHRHLWLRRPHLALGLAWLKACEFGGIAIGSVLARRDS
jgi:glycosyltransferase involved in cell wall biosynthesis